MPGGRQSTREPGPRHLPVSRPRLARLTFPPSAQVRAQRRRRQLRARGHDRTTQSIAADSQCPPGDRPASLITPPARRRRICSPTADESRRGVMASVMSSFTEVFGARVSCSGNFQHTRTFGCGQRAGRNRAAGGADAIRNSCHATPSGPCLARRRPKRRIRSIRRAGERRASSACVAYKLTVALTRERPNWVSRGARASSVWLFAHRVHRKRWHYSL